MAERRPSLMEPRIETLMNKVDSKFTLVTLAAMRAREINDYYNQLGEGLGRIVPPQVTSVSRKPLSIALEEIAVNKIVYERVADPRDRRRGCRRGRGRRDRRLDARRVGLTERPSSSPVAEPCPAMPRVVLGVCGGIAAYKAVEVCRRLVDAGVHVAPGPDRRRAALRRRAHLLRARVRARPHLAVRRSRADPAHAARPERRPRRRRAGHRAAARQVRGRHLRRPARPPRCSPPGRPCSCARPCTPRCGSTPPSRRTSPRLRRRGVHVLDPEDGPPRGRRLRRRPPGRPAAHRARRVLGLLAGDHPLTGRTVLVTAGGTREAIDPVRFVGNRSSGKMGHALANVAARLGARVVLVTTAQPARRRRRRGRAGRERAGDARRGHGSGPRAPTR